MFESKRSKLGGIAVLALVVGIGALWFFPPRWMLNAAKPVDMTDPANTGRALVEDYKCRQCHFIDARGKPSGPNLSGVTKRFGQAELRLWLQDPRAVRWRTIMPNFDLSDSEIEAIMSYLTALDESS